MIKKKNMNLLDQHRKNKLKYWVKLKKSNLHYYIKNK